MSVSSYRVIYRLLSSSMEKKEKKEKKEKQEKKEKAVSVKT